MACLYCWREIEREIKSFGKCVECGLDVCTRPPERPDKRFHADLCPYGHLVCRFHVHKHAGGEKGSAVTTAPSLALAGSTEVLRTANDELNKGRSAGRLPPEAVAVFNEFLNFVTPGYAELASSIERSRDTGVGELTSRERDDEAKIDRLNFAPEFYAEGAIERVAALAADTLGTAWRAQKARKRGVIELEWLDSGFRKVLDGMKLLLPMKALEVERLLRSVAPEGATLSPSLMRALAYTPVPTGASAIADWVVSATVSQGVLAE